MNDNERQSQNRNNALHFTGSKTSREEMEKMSNELADEWKQL